MAIKYTYWNKDNVTEGTCPCCLGSYRVKGTGLVYRHGFNVHNRGTGRYGWQTGACQGWDFQPLETSDRGGIYFVAKLVEDIKKAKEKVSSAKKTPRESYTSHFYHQYGNEKYVNQLLSDLRGMGLQCETSNAKPEYLGQRVQVNFKFEVPAGFAGGVTTNYHKVPSYASLRAAELKRLQGYVSYLEAHKARLETAIEGFRAKQAA